MRQEKLKGWQMYSIFVAIFVTMLVLFYVLSPEKKVTHEAPEWCPVGYIQNGGGETSFASASTSGEFVVERLPEGGYVIYQRCDNAKN